jgi:hypothetical protein
MNKGKQINLKNLMIKRFNSNILENLKEKQMNFIVKNLR